jgi:FMN reductase
MSSTSETGECAVIKVNVVVGNPKPQSRTAGIATQLVEALLLPDSYELTVIDLADHVHQVFEWPSEEMSALTETVAQSDLLIAASPTYKATYTGLLKTFFDRYPNLGLRGVVAVPVMTGNDTRHAMAPEISLRPLLVELGAIVPTQALYFVMQQMGDADAVLAEWAREARERLAAHLPGALASLRVPRTT